MKRPTSNMIKRVMWPLAPLPGESLMGFIGRVAAHNVIDDTLSITAQAGQRFGHRARLIYSNDANLEALSTALRVDVAELKSRTHPKIANGISDFFGLGVPFYHIETKVRRFSPSALATNPYHRAIWTYRPIPFCVETWEYLADRCDICGAVQSWYHARGPERCDNCAADLTATAVDTVPEHLQKVLSFVAGLADPLDERRAAAMRLVPESLRHLRAEAILELIFHLGHLTGASGYRGRRCARWRQNPSAHAEMLHDSAELVLEWPEKPRRLFADRIASQTGKGNNAVLRNTGPLFWSAHHVTLTEEVRETIKSLFPRACTRDPVGPTPITVRRSSEISGLARRELAEYRRAGLLKTVVFMSGSSAMTAGFDEAEILWLTEAIRSRWSTASVASALGISIHGVEQLACLGRLTPISHPIFTGRYDRPHFEGAAVESLFNGLRAAARASLPGITLREAVRAIPGPKPWGPIIDAMLDGRLPFGLAADKRLALCATIAPKSISFLRSLKFHKQTHGAFAFEDCMSKKDAFEALNLLPSDGAFLGPGMVATTKAMDYRVVRADFVEQMARRFVSISELRARSGPLADDVKSRLALAGAGAATAFGWPREMAEAAVFGDGDELPMRKLFAPADSCPKLHAQAAG